MCGNYVYVFFEGEGKESVAREFKDFLEALLGEQVGVGRVFELPWEDPAEVQRQRSKPGPDDPGHDGPWSFARSVFSLPTYEAHFLSQDPEDEWFDESLYAEDEEDESLCLFGSELPPEWRDAPLVLCFPPFALPAGTSEERRESRPKARKLLQWLRRSQRRKRELEIHVSAGFFAPIYLGVKEMTAARLLAMSAELDAEEPGLSEPSLDLDLALEDPEQAWVEPKDQPSWPARIWQRWMS